MTTPMATLGERMCLRALDWLYDNRDHATMPPDLPADLVDSMLFKAVSEIGLAGRLVLRQGSRDSGTVRVATALLEHTWRQLGDGEVLYRLQVRNPAATHAIETYSIFAAAGYRHPALDRLAAHVTTLRSYQVPELIPNRQLALLAAARRLGLPPHRDPAVLTAETWLGGTPEPWMLDTNNCYSLTHTVFHLTDHGARPDDLPEELREYVRRWLPVWLDVYTEAGFWDLLGELLIVDMCLDTPTWYVESWERYAAAQQEDGMMANGLHRPTRDPVQTFRYHYHSTVVAAVAGTLLASRVPEPV